MCKLYEHSRASGNPILFWMPAFAGMTFLLLTESAAAETLRIDHAVCHYITVHVPDADVTYRPGADLHGKKVVPADINASPINDIGNDVHIKLTNDTAKVFDLNVPTIDRGNEKVPLAEPEMEYYIHLKNGVPT